MDKHERAIMIAKHIIENRQTVRELSKVFGIGKTTVHKDLTDGLREANSPLRAEVATILEEHRKVRHIRGGVATKAKFTDAAKEVSE